MTKRVLAEAHGQAVGPGRFGVPGDVPAGGAVDVEWEASIGGLAGPTGDTLEGPGCAWDGWQTSFVESAVYGHCGDLPQGTMTFELVLQGAATSYDVVVSGWVPLDAATEPAASADATET